MLKTSVLDGPQFDYVNPGNPTISVNPKKLYATWLNISTGELFICLDVDFGSNVWRGQFGTTIMSLVKKSYYPQSVLLLPLRDNVQDYSPLSGTLTKVGLAILSNTESKYINGSSLYSPDPSSYYTLTAPADPAYNLGSGDFTLEFYVKLKTGNINEYITLLSVDSSLGTTTIRFGDNGFNNRLQVGVDSSLVVDLWNVPATMSTFFDTWRHISFVRQSNECSVFIDGVLQTVANGISSTYSATSFTDSRIVSATPSGSITINTSYGYIQDVKFLNLAYRTANFTPELILGV